MESQNWSEYVDAGPRGNSRASARRQPAWEQLVHPEDRAAAIGWVKEAIETGQPLEREWRVLWPDGSVHWILGRFRVFKDAAGKPMRLTGVNIDISERRRAEQALRDSESRLSAIVGTAADAIIVIDEEGNIQSINPATERIFGYSQGETVGDNISMLMPEPQRPAAGGYPRELPAHGPS